MEDHYLVYCIYILNILSFTLKFLFFQFLPYFVIVWTLLPVFKIAISSCDTLAIPLSNIMTDNLTVDAFELVSSKTYQNKYETVAHT